MNTGHFSLRDLKRMCREAVGILCAEHGYNVDDFAPAKEDETIYAPPLLQKRFQRNGFASPAAGTLIYWSRTSYEYEEYDAILPTELLSEIEFWSSPEAEEKIREMLAQQENDVAPQPESEDPDLSAQAGKFGSSSMQAAPQPESGKGGSK